MIKSRKLHLLILVLVLILIVSLCACNTNNDETNASNNSTSNTIQASHKVKIVTSDIMRSTSQNVYSVDIFDEAFLYAIVTDLDTLNPTYNWFKKSNDKFESLSEHGSKLKVDSSTNGNFYYYVEVEGVKSEEVQVVVDYAQVKIFDITSDNANIQAQRLQYLDEDLISPKTITLKGSFNKNQLEPISEYPTCWYEDGIKLGDGDSLTYVVQPLIDSEDFRNIQLSYRVYTNKYHYDEKIIDIDVIRSYDLLDDINLDVRGASALRDDASPCNYIQIDPNKNFTPVTITATQEPLYSNLYSKAVFRVRNEIEDKKQKIEGRSYTYTPIHGKNVISVTIENVISYEVIIYAFTLDDVDKYEKYILDQHYFNGNWNDKYIIDQIDLNSAFANHLAKHKENLIMEWYIARKTWVIDDEITASFYKVGSQDNALGYALSNAGEAGLYDLNVSANGLYFGSSTIFTGEQGPIVPTYKVEQSSDVEPTYISDIGMLEKYNLNKDIPLQDQRIFPIDNREEMLAVNSDMLFRVIGWGYKPSFEDSEEGKELENLYKKIREVMARIVDEGMDDIQKVFAIYEWIVYNVAYDYDLVLKENAEDMHSNRYSGYYLEGVFNDHRAVCDGRSKAVVAMCGIFDIKAIRVVGIAKGALGYLLGGHAWNKVFLDPDKNGIRSWYVVDTTWGDGATNRINVNGVPIEKDMIETLNYDYCFKTDRDLVTHEEKLYDCPPADTMFVYRREKLI